MKEVQWVGTIHTAWLIEHYYNRDILKEIYSAHPYDKKVLIMWCLGRIFILNESKASILLWGIGHIYPWRTHLSESRREAATVRIGLFSKTLMRIKIERMAINSANPQNPSLVNIMRVIAWSLVKEPSSRHSSLRYLKWMLLTLSVGSSSKGSYTYCII